jgi:hypothetical protein
MLETLAIATTVLRVGNTTNKQIYERMATVAIVHVNNIAKFTSTSTSLDSFIFDS